MRDRIEAPEIVAFSWLNTPAPLTIEELRGNVVVLDFWTYCCINCMHVLPVLRELEESRAGQPVVVIGVHSGKFDAEQEPEKIQEAIQRYGIAHPVAVDYGMETWRAYGVRSWPTIVVIRPDGTIAAIAPGEVDFPTLDAFVGRLIEEARSEGSLADKPFQPPKADYSNQPHLSFPGKLCLMPEDRFVVSDSSNNRLLLCDLNGSVVETIGSGLRGFMDGGFAEACFDDPQGCEFFDGCLYVADTRNHAIRRIDFETRSVVTVAGTGELGRTTAVGPVKAAEFALRSPWDICAVRDELCVAMAGSHQLWMFNPRSQLIRPWAGTGAEALRDGPLAKSAWAQPSSLSLMDGKLYVADSETSAIRVVDLEDERVDTLVGKGLFDFGDLDGPAGRALLQHCLGVCATAEGVYIADSYNGKVKFLDFAAESVTTVISGLSEPADVKVLPDGSLLIADTNNHRIVRFKEGALMEVPILCGPPAKGSRKLHAQEKPSGTPVEWFTSLLQLEDGIGLGEGRAEVRLALSPPKGRKFAIGAPLTVAVEISRRPDLLIPTSERFSSQIADAEILKISIPFEIRPLGGSVIEAEAVARIDTVTCAIGGESFCEPLSTMVRLPIRLKQNSGSAIEFRLDM
ncbi:MAG: thioredoxin-like domain-containing protein [Planctomycetota bacterium]